MVAAATPTGTAASTLVLPLLALLAWMALRNAALPASEALFSTVTVTASGSLSRSIDCLAALNTSLPNELFW